MARGTKNSRNQARKRVASKQPPENLDIENEIAMTDILNCAIPHFGPQNIRSVRTYGFDHVKFSHWPFFDNVYGRVKYNNCSHLN